MQCCIQAIHNRALIQRRSLGLRRVWIVLDVKIPVILEHFAHLSESLLRGITLLQSEWENQAKSSIQAIRNPVLVQSENHDLKRLWSVANANLHAALKYFANLRRSRDGSTLSHTSNLIAKYYAASKQSTIACLYRAEVLFELLFPQASAVGMPLWQGG